MHDSSFEHLWSVVSNKTLLIRSCSRDVLPDRPVKAAWPRPLRTRAANGFMTVSAGRSSRYHSSKHNLRRLTVLVRMRSQTKWTAFVSR